MQHYSQENIINIRITGANDRNKSMGKDKGLVECYKCRLCGEHRKTVHHLLSGCKKIVGTEYVKRHNNTLKVLAVKWAVENGMLPEDTKWYITNWKRGNSSGTGNIQ